MTDQRQEGYEPPRVLSFREGFSADHSHECYGCAFCGPENHNIIVKNCMICGSGEYECDEAGNDYCQYCKVSRFGDDFCSFSPLGLCRDHGRKVKARWTSALMDRIISYTPQSRKHGSYGENVIKDHVEGFNEGDEVTLEVCSACYDALFIDAFRYCEKCETCVLPDGNTCPTCKNATLGLPPSSFEAFVKEARLGYPVIFVNDANFTPTTAQVIKILEIMASEWKFDNVKTILAGAKEHLASMDSRKSGALRDGLYLPINRFDGKGVLEINRAKDALEFPSWDEFFDENDYEGFDCYDMYLARGMDDVIATNFYIYKDLDGNYFSERFLTYTVEIAPRALQEMENVLQKPVKTGVVYLAGEDGFEGIDWKAIAARKIDEMHKDDPSAGR